MIVGRRWIYSKYGSAQEYFISKRSKYKDIVECAIMSFSDRYCINFIRVDKYNNKRYTIIIVNACNDATDLFDKIDNKIIEALRAAECRTSLCKIQTMKGEGECRIIKKRQRHLRKK